MILLPIGKIQWKNLCLVPKHHLELISATGNKNIPRTCSLSKTSAPSLDKLGAFAKFVASTNVENATRPFSIFARFCIFHAVLD
jgi:hypothetical protein